MNYFNNITKHIKHLYNLILANINNNIDNMYKILTCNHILI